MTVIQKLDGKNYDLADYGIRTRDLLISAPTPNHHFSEVDGISGVVDYGTDFSPRYIKALYRAQSHDVKDFSLLRNELFNVMRTESAFYLIEKRIRGIRWLVKVANPYDIPQRGIFGNFEIDFIGIKGVSESVASSMTIHNKGINAESNFWSYGMGIIEEPASRLYKHTGTNFKIYNMGDVKINHYNFDFEIKITNVKGSVNSFELINRTNGTVFNVKNKVNQGDVIEIKKGQVLRNTANYMRNTTRTFIELEPGYNEFEIRGATSATVEFDFKAYYL